MYRNKCTKCGAEFETKNPKRVICPACLYPDRKDLSLESYKQPASEPVQSPQGKEDQNFKQKSPGYYVAKDTQQTQPDRGYQDRGYQDRGYQQDRNYGPPRPQRPPGNYGGGSPGGAGGGFRRPQPAQPYNQQRPMGGGPPAGGFRRPPFQQQGRPPFQGGQRDNRFSGPRRPPTADKKLLISREQVAEIEKLYMAMLPLPNPDCHEVIGEKIGLEGNKVFFGINLVRQKLRLPKLPYPKRKLAISPDQLTAIKNLYSPLLPLPPIGCHKFLAKQLKMDEWRVHVGIGIIRKQMSLPRWNTERDDAPAEFKNQAPPPEKKQEKKQDKE
ncbi:MAG: hypothetical protein A2Y25_04420 [Candidatus Melainabacteria bacterium GWF2_37_15]|nr:MAG: hypothetical protein A2Y25_04420 [Candidatus Melainabacteria bacterium GWF2_37_15]